MGTGSGSSRMAADFATFFSLSFCEEDGWARFWIVSNPHLGGWLQLLDLEPPRKIVREKLQLFFQCDALKVVVCYTKMKGKEINLQSLSGTFVPPFSILRPPFEALSPHTWCWMAGSGVSVYLRGCLHDAVQAVGMCRLTLVSFGDSVEPSLVLFHWPLFVCWVPWQSLWWKSHRGQ